MRRRALGTLAVLLILSACASSGGSPQPSGDAPRPPTTDSGSPGETPAPGDGIEHPTGDEPVLVVRTEGGLMPVDFAVTALPSFVMLGDGRVIVQGAVPAIFPGPALPALQERTLTEEGIQTVLEAVEDTGLFTSDLELRGAAAMVADAPDTIFQLNAAGRSVRVSVYGLGFVSDDMEPPPGMSSAELEAHRILTRLSEALFLIDTSVPAEQWEADGWQPYAPEAIRLFVRDVTGEPPDESMPEDVHDWPIAGEDPATFGEEFALFGDGSRCGVVTGDAAAAWLADLTEATQITRWTSDGDDRYSVIVRPLFPFEDPSCEPVG